MKNKKHIDRLINNNLSLPIEATENYINNFMYKSLSSINEEVEVKPNRTYIIKHTNNLFDKADNFIECIIDILDTDEGNLIDKKDLKLKRNVKRSSVNRDLTIYTIIESLTYNNAITMMLIKNINSKDKSCTGELIFDINISDELGKDVSNKNVYLS